MEHPSPEPSPSSTPAPDIAPRNQRLRESPSDISRCALARSEDHLAEQLLASVRSTDASASLPARVVVVGPTRAIVRKWITSSAISTVANEEVHLPGSLR
jgi:hypothetical protein